MAAESHHNYFTAEPEQILFRENNLSVVETEKIQIEINSSTNLAEEIKIAPKFVSSQHPSMIRKLPRNLSINKIKSQAAKQRDFASKNRQIFKQFVDSCGENSFRWKLTQSESDYMKILDLDHCYTTYEQNVSIGESSSPKKFYHQLFLTQYNQLILNEAEILTGENDINIAEIHEKPKKSIIEPIDNYKDSFFDESDKCADKIKSILNGDRIENENKIDSNEDSSWEETLKGAISSNLRKISEKIVKILLDQILCNRAVEKRSDETNVVENSRIKNASRLRSAFSTVVADRNSTEILNSALIKYLPVEILSIYIGLWKVLKCKVPELVSRIFDVQPTADEETKRISDVLKEFFDLKIASSLSNVAIFKTVHLTKNPLIILISPSFKVFGQLSQSSDRCRHFFKNLLPQLGKCCEIKFPPLKKDSSLFEANQKLFQVVVEKLIEIRVGNPTRHMILVGWDSSCLIALISALEFPVAACVCFSFPNVTLNGLRGDIDDDILDVACPILFVVGQFATTCSIDDLQDTKERMKSGKVGVVVVGGANNELKSSFNKLCTENVTQKIVDKCILDSVGEFLNEVLVTLPDIAPPKPVATVDTQAQPPELQMAPLEPETKRRCLERSDMRLTIKIPPVLEPEAPAIQKIPVLTAMEPSPGFNLTAPVPSTIPILDPIKVQQRPRSSSAGTNLFLNAESPLGAYASGSGFIDTRGINDADDDWDQKSLTGSNSASVTRTRQVKKPVVLDL